MKAHLIIFEGLNFTGIIQRIKNIGSWAKIAENTFIVISELNTVEVRTRICQEESNISKVFVINVTNKSWASYGVKKEVTEWLKEHLNI